MRYLVLTVDYEIFGNGTGDVRRHVVDPTERMARICERHGVPLTVFLEAEELVAFRRFARQLERSLGYDPARLIADQVKSLAGRGHDFQLHLHPQWHRAQYDGTRWALTREHETVDHLFETVEETSQYIAERKGIIEELVHRGPGEPGVMTYRAGAFSARPGRRLLPALAASGFALESSVVKGLFRPDQHYTLDYRDVRIPQRLWRMTDDVGQATPAGPLWEVPIHSEIWPRWRQVTWPRLRAKFSRHIPREQRQNTIERFANPRHPLEMWRSLWEPVPIKLDFHNLSPTELHGMVRRADWRSGYGPVDVLVLIGHTKEHTDDGVLEAFLAGVAAAPDLKVISFPELAEKIRQAEAAPADVIRPAAGTVFAA